MAEKDEEIFVQDIHGKWGLGGNCADWLFHEGSERWNSELAKYPEANIYFNDCDLSKDGRNGIISFCGYRFPEHGSVFFLNTNFGDNAVSFEGVIFGDGDVCFDNAKFGKGHVIFTSTKFGKGRSSFMNTDFGEGNVYFGGAIFGGDVSFHGSYAGDGEYDFNHASFKGHANFSSMFQSEHIKGLTFRNAIFEKSFDLTNNMFSCVPDLVGTKVSSHVSLHGVHCELKRMSYWSTLPSLFPQANDARDVAKLRRLKELAESNKDHAAALRFYADEMRAKRGNKEHGMGFWKSFLDLLYSATSNYGQSIGKPAIWLFSVSAVFFACLLMDSKGVVESMILLIANAVPFVASAKTILDCHKDAAGILMFHGLLSFVFIFLIGLGFRNRFRV